jgi:hypothetical protein
MNNLVNNVKSIYFIWGVLILLVAACQNIGEDVPGTLTAGPAVLETEAAQMAGAGQQDQAVAAGTIAAGETQVAERYSINDQLFATIAVGSTPTIALIVGQAPLNQSDMMVNGERLLTQTGISLTVNQSNGCVIDPRGSFQRDEITTIYATAQVINASGSLELRADWFHEGELITQTYWTVNPVTSPTCFWASIDRSDTDFPPGDYTVQMYLDNSPLIDLTMSFLVND